MTKETIELSRPAAGGRPRPARRSQAERSQSMRRRLLDATLACLAEEGYAATTVSAIVRRAGVSRGAQLHHYASKNALILAAAERLMRRAYRLLGEVLLGIADEDDRLNALMQAFWDDIFDSALFDAFLELLLASQRDEELAGALRELARRGLEVGQQAMHHYFVPRQGDEATMEQLFQMTPMVLGGIAASRHLADDGDTLRRQIGLWTGLMASRIKARRGVRSPPPRPRDWDSA